MINQRDHPSELAASRDGDDQEYEDTERSNLRLQRERQEFLRNSSGDNQYKFIDDGYDGQGQDAYGDEE